MCALRAQHHLQWGNRTAEVSGWALLLSQLIFTSFTAVLKSEQLVGSTVRAEYPRAVFFSTGTRFISVSK